MSIFSFTEKPLCSSEEDDRRKSEDESMVTAKDMCFLENGYAGNKNRDPVDNLCQQLC